MYLFWLNLCHSFCWIVIFWPLTCYVENPSTLGLWIWVISKRANHLTILPMSCQILGLLRSSQIQQSRTLLSIRQEIQQDWRRKSRLKEFPLLTLVRTYSWSLRVVHLFCFHWLHGSCRCAIEGSIKWSWDHPGRRPIDAGEAARWNKGVDRRSSFSCMGNLGQSEYFDCKFSNNRVLILLSSSYTLVISPLR